MNVLIVVINATVNVLSIFIVIYSLLSFVLDPFHPIREAMSRVVEPMLAPVRKILPTMGGLDFSPLVLMVLIQVVGSILVAIIRSIG